MPLSRENRDYRSKRGKPGAASPIQRSPVLKPLTTPDLRYIIVRGRLWRAVNPELTPELRSALVSELMDARREVNAAGRAKDARRLTAARAAVHAAKVALGERGPVWWTDGEKDFNRYLVKNSPYANWYSDLQTGDAPP